MVVTRIVSVVLHRVLLNYRITDDNRPTTVADVFTSVDGGRWMTNLPVNAMVAPSADKQTRNYDTECSNHHPSLSI